MHMKTCTYALKAKLLMHLSPERTGCIMPAFQRSFLRSCNPAAVPRLWRPKLSRRCELSTLRMHMLVLSPCYLSVLGYMYRFFWTQ